MGLSQNRVAREIAVPPRRINEIVLGKRRVTAETDLRLSRFFGTSAEFWMSLQQRYDLERLRDEIAALPGVAHAVRLLERLAVEKQPLHAGAAKQS